MTKLRQIAKELLPPAITRRLRRPPAPNGVVTFTGHYSTWQEASRDAIGYDAPLILAKTREALLKVRRGEAAYERDSVVFDEIEHSFPLLAGLLSAAAERGGVLHVLDFGGSLGSSYFQCRGFLSNLKELRWSVVEQAAHVECGRRDFANDQLSFHESIDACLANGRADVLLLSGSVQFMPEPYAFLEDALRHDFDHVIVDRTPFTKNGSEHLAVEHVPDWIYTGSYPTWFLSEPRFLGCFAPRYSTVATFRALDAAALDTDAFAYKGFLFRRTKAAAGGG